MAESKTPPKAAPGADPSIQVIAQYIKDFSFENPQSPESLLGNWPSPETNVQVSLSQKHVRDNAFESTLRFRVEAKNKQTGQLVFIIDLHYGALVTLANVPQEHLPAVLAVEVPKLLFPFVRERIATTTSQGGYPPLFLTPINFEALYLDAVKRQQAEDGKQKAKS